MKHQIRDTNFVTLILIENEPLFLLGFDEERDLANWHGDPATSGKLSSELARGCRDS